MIHSFMGFSLYGYSLPRFIPRCNYIPNKSLGEGKTKNGKEQVKKKTPAETGVFNGLVSLAGGG
jgi:hypothetical protein